MNRRSGRPTAWIAFLSERTASAPLPEAKEAKDDAKPDGRQIWLISPNGGEAWTLTAHGAAVNTFRWSPDGKRIAFAAPVPESKAKKDRKEKYSDYEVFQSDYEQNQLWVVDERTHRRRLSRRSERASGHEAGRRARPKSQRALLQHNYDWFAHWLWGEESEMPRRGNGE